jgi:hypothetical protein
MALSHLRPAIAFEKFLQAFVCFSDELLSSSKPVIVLAYQKENNQDQVKKCFLPLAFLLLERDDIVRVSISIKFFEWICLRELEAI